MISKSKIISLILSLLIILIFYFLNPGSIDLASFNENFKRSLIIQSCQKKLPISPLNLSTSTSHVLTVIDGDTLEILTPECKIERVRLIGINTPETVDPRRPVQCFGKEASNFAKKILKDKDVFVISDPTQDKKDKYGRFLAYVFLSNNVLFNKLMIEEGFAYEYTYIIPYKYQEEFKEAEQSAKNRKKGLWSPDTCNGQK